MPGPGEPPARHHAPIIGRDAALARVRGLVDPVPQSSQVLLVIGEAGMGKTVLLADAAGRARSSGTRVLSVTGRESESRLAFAGLHQLLRPVLSSAAGLPGRQAQALLAAFGLAAAPGVPDLLLTRVAVLTLLSDLSESSPVLVVADDAHWLDRGSLEALAFVGMERAADALAPRRVGDLVFPITQSYVEDVVLVDDTSILAAQQALWRALRIAAEPAGSVGIAALLAGAYKPEPGERVAVVISGANMAPSQLG